MNLTERDKQIIKDKGRKMSSREVLTPKWTDWIDYWAVDFDYENRKEIIRVVEEGGTGVSPVGLDETGAGSPRYKDAWTGKLHLRERMAKLPYAQEPRP